MDENILWTFLLAGKEMAVVSIVFPKSFQCCCKLLQKVEGRIESLISRQFLQQI